MPYLKIENNKISIDAKFTDKYIFIMGDSGVGKSLIVDTLSDEESFNKDVETDLEIKVLNKNTLSTFDSWNNGELVVMDETYARKVISKLSNKKCYFMVVTRKVFKNINFSPRCIYTASRINGKTIIIPKYLNINNTNYLNAYDAVITEDSGYGYIFVKACLGDKYKHKVLSAGGKSNIKNKLDDLSQNVKTILVIMDNGGVGSDISVILNKIKNLSKKGLIVHTLSPECFEHALLCSKYFSYPNNIEDYCTLDFNDVELFCETLIEYITRDTVLLCDHTKGVLSACWYEQCSNCNLNCPYRVLYCKFEHVLKDGPMSHLLVMRNNT